MTDSYIDAAADRIMRTLTVRKSAVDEKYIATATPGTVGYGAMIGHRVSKWRDDPEEAVLEVRESVATAIAQQLAIDDWEDDAARINEEVREMWKEGP